MAGDPSPNPDPETPGAMAALRRLHPIEVLVVSPDVAWSFAVREVLERRGCVTALECDSAGAPIALRRLRPHVAVVDATHAAGPVETLVAETQAAGLPVCFVVVTEAAAPALPGLDVHEKWTTPDALFTAVERAYHRPQPAGRWLADP